MVFKVAPTVFSAAGNWYKANLHTHTRSSDGDKTAEERAKQYKQAGYSILAITDHNLTNDISGLSDHKFLVISGAEYAVGTKEFPGELLLLNVRHPKRFETSQSAQEVIDSVTREGGLCFVSHPYWIGLTTPQINKLQGYLGIEVYNYSCADHARENSEVHWDQLLEGGQPVLGIAADDTHVEDQLFKGWIMLKSNSLSLGDVIAALRAGQWYSSTGPEIHEVSFCKSAVQIRCSPVTAVYCLGSSPEAAFEWVPAGQTKTEFRIDLTSFRKTRYCRVKIVDPSGCAAWTNPFVLEES